MPSHQREKPLQKREERCRFRRQFACSAQASRGGKKRQHPYLKVYAEGVGTMSAEATSWAWSQGDATENSGQLMVLLALAEHASPEGLCYPKRKTIARMCGLARAGSVTRHVNKLEQLGLVERNPRFMQHAHVKGEEAVRQTSNEYRLCLEVKGIELGGAVALPTSPAPPTSDAPELPGLGSTEATPVEPSEKEPNTEPTDSPEAAAKKVYDHYLHLFQPKRPPEFGAAVTKQISKGLAVYSAEDLCLAFTGLFEWRKKKPGKTNLGAVLDTYPGGKPLHEQIAFFITQAEGATTVNGKFPSVPRARIAEHQRWVLRGHRLPDNAEAVKKGKESQVWLFEHGIVTIPAGPVEDRPSFRPRLDGDEVVPEPRA